MAVGTGLLSVEEFLKLPDPREGHHELHHGEVVVEPPPKKGHQEVQGRLLILLMRGAGENWVVRVEMAFRPGPEHEVWQADVGCVSRERDDAAAADEYLMSAPELVVEVLSPSNTVHEINDKMSICMANGCLSFWTVDDKRKRVSVTEGDVTRHYGLPDSIFCSLFQTEVRVAEIFDTSSL
jgi:Uma2 family endonuclease